MFSVDYTGFGKKSTSVSRFCSLIGSGNAFKWCNMTGQLQVRRSGDLFTQSIEISQSEL